MNKQIEELEEDLKHIIEDKTWTIKKLAKGLTNLGYQKVGKDSVILTKEDLKHYAKDCLIGEIAGLDILNGLIERAERKEKEARKETTEKFIGLRKYIIQQFHNYHEARDKAEAEYKKCKEEIGKAVLNNDWHRADAIMFILEQISIEFDRIIESLKQ